MYKEKYWKRQNAIGQKERFQNDKGLFEANHCDEEIGGMIDEMLRRGMIENSTVGISWRVKDFIGLSPLQNHQTLTTPNSTTGSL
jgi:hypothetical protein